jgi:hypothetical protein
LGWTSVEASTSASTTMPRELGRAGIQPETNPPGVPVMRLILPTILLLSSATATQESWVPIEPMLPAEGYGTTDNYFGRAVSAWDDWAVVGSPGVGSDTYGAVYVFERKGLVWEQQARVMSSRSAAGDDLGRAVGLAPGIAVAGAPGESLGTGAAYVFEGMGKVWPETARFEPPVALSGADFGRSVVISGITVLVGAPGLETVFVYEKLAGVWANTAEIRPGSAAPGFGWSLAFDGKTLVVGSPADESAHVFVRSATAWSETARLAEDESVASESFGHSVALSATRIAVGAPEGEGAGRVVVFDFVGGNWIRTAAIAGSNLQQAAEFGYAVALSGDRLLVGAPGEEQEFGVAKLFERGPGGWSEVTEFSTPLQEGDGRFGAYVALYGDCVFCNFGLDDTPIFGVYAGQVQVWMRPQSRSPRGGRLR